MISQDTALLLICSCLHKMLEYPYEGISIREPTESKLYEDHFQIPSTPSTPHWDCCRCLRTLHIWLKDCPQREQL